MPVDLLGHLGHLLRLEKTTQLFVIVNDLKYLFTAFYLDGASFRQPADDLSSVDPAKSSFFDVDHSKLVSFQLSGQGRLAEVNLMNGQIWLDDKMVVKPVAGEVFSLVYFRRHTVSTLVGGGNTSAEQSHAVEYHVGWSHPVRGTHTISLP